MTGTHDPNMLRAQLLRDSSGRRVSVAGARGPCRWTHRGRIVGCSSEAVDGHGSIVDR